MEVNESGIQSLLSSEKIKAAYALAVRCHAEQTDKSGAPYIGHPIRVAIRAAGVGEDAAAAALLHDVVEDGHATLGEVACVAGERVASIVDALSRRKGSETYMEFIDRVCDHSKEAAFVKLADIADNSDPARLAKLPPEEQGIVRRYEKAAARIRERVFL